MTTSFCSRNPKNAGIGRIFNFSIRLAGRCCGVGIYPMNRMINSWPRIGFCFPHNSIQSFSENGAKIELGNERKGEV